MYICYNILKQIKRTNTHISTSLFPNGSLLVRLKCTNYCTMHCHRYFAHVAFRKPSNTLSEMNLGTQLLAELNCHTSQGSGIGRASQGFLIIPWIEKLKFSLQLMGLGWKGPLNFCLVLFNSWTTSLRMYVATNRKSSMSITKIKPVRRFRSNLRKCFLQIWARVCMAVAEDTLLLPLEPLANPN